jgi:ribose transport system ATP-binding protein
MIMNNKVIKAENIYKNFGGTQALKGVDFELIQGEVHALIGENGAGKSTFSRIISGDLQRNSGIIYFNGVEKNLKNCIAAKAEGIYMVYQELRLIPYFTVTENIFLREYLKNPIGLLSWEKMHKKAKELMERWNISFNPRNIVSNLPISQQQIVEILRNLYGNPKVLIMDEPTSSLGWKEVKSLFDMINYIKLKGVAIIYISHILDEVFTISDRITVFRDGKNVGTYITKETSSNTLVKAMLSKSLSTEIKKEPVSNIASSKKVILELKNINKKNFLDNINLKLYEGEILGIIGLLGSGKTELARGIVGLDKLDSGEIYINKNKIIINSIRDAINNGIGLIPEDRRKDGIFKLMSINDNLTFIILKIISKFGLINKKKQSKISTEYSEKLNIKFKKLTQVMDDLSGGNQQKVVIARWMTIDPKILIADEPTRGIDVGTKFEVYQLFKKIANLGKSILVFSEEVDEIIYLSDRVLVMNRGKIIDELEKHMIEKEELIKLVTGLKNNNE